jgi:methionyl-tRNA formyltransferase
MNAREVTIIFLGHNFGQIVRKKLQEAGFTLIDPRSMRADLIVVGFYGKILSKKTLGVPKYGALNVHPSLLPKYRGPSPVQNTILNNDTQTGVTIILMDEKADHGPIIATANFEIGNRKFTTPELTKELWELGGDLLVKTIPKWIAGEIKPVAQDHANATYTKMLRREDGHINWNKSAKEIERQIRAFTPWPGSFTFLRKTRIKIISGYVPTESRADEFSPGQTFIYKDNEFGVKTKGGIFVIEKLQPEGKGEITAKQFLNGHPAAANAFLK